jgi:hypothetical protein
MGSSVSQSLRGGIARRSGEPERDTTPEVSDV